MTFVGSEFDACIGGQWYHVLVREETAQFSRRWGTFIDDYGDESAVLLGNNPIEVEVRMLMWPLSEAPRPAEFTETEALTAATLQIEKGKS